MDKVLYKDYSSIDVSTGKNLVDVAILRQSVNTVFRVWFLSKNTDNKLVRVMDEFQLCTKQIIGENDAFDTSKLEATKNTYNTDYNLYYGTYNGDFHIFSDAIKPIVECFSSDAGIANGIKLIQQLTGSTAENMVKSTDVTNLTAFSLSKFNTITISEDMIGKGVKIGKLADNSFLSFHVAPTSSTYKSEYKLDKLGGSKRLIVSHNGTTDTDFPVAIVDDGTSVYIKFLKKNFIVYLDGIINKEQIDASSFTVWTTILDCVYPGQPGGNYATYDLGHQRYIVNNKKPYWWDGTTIRDANGMRSNVLYKGSTDSRPTSNLTTSDNGFMYFDTTLNQPIWWNGSAWVDATGTPV